MTSVKNSSTDIDLLAALPDSPDAYPQKLDLVRTRVLLIAFDESSYRGASFLDDRVLGPATQGAWVPLERAASAARLGQHPRPLHFILHAGHVGSTLLSRLLESTGTVLSLREPLPLRTLADASDDLDRPDSLLSSEQFMAVVETFARLWSRGYPGTQAVVLKATSSSARVAPALLRRDLGSRAVYLNLRAEPYLATLLAGANSAIDLRGHGSERMRRLCQRLASPPQPLHALTHGELAAMSWLAETLTQRELLHAMPGQVLAVDFDDFLADMATAMARVTAHLRVATAPGWLAQLAANPVLMRYSKAPNHEYSPALRAQVLKQARHEHRDEIRRGLAWLETLARSEPAVARVLQVDAP